MSLAVYKCIDPENPIFDGRRARLHLINQLGMQTMNHTEASNIMKLFEEWLRMHHESISIHPKGPFLISLSCGAGKRNVMNSSSCIF